MGSPPRMRGKGTRGAAKAAPLRITPAYAGKSRRWRCVRRGCTDHPRVCGEKSTSTIQNAVSIGSPPRMRGKGLFFISSHRFFGITPAYAGKRVTSHFSNRSATDHPRVCGEKGRDRQKRRSRTGSPPRMRGKGRVVPGKSLL